ncbi:hypothetical protein G3480_25425, partial [Thiorhodococcus mannitoliphagus]
TMGSANVFAKSTRCHSWLTLSSPNSIGSTSSLSEGVFFARVQNIKPYCISHVDYVFIDEDADVDLRRSRCKEADVVFTITGYPGTAAYVSEDDLPMNINQHSARFDVEDTWGAGYVCAALNSRFVKLQVERSAIGGTRDALDYPSVKGLLIPIFDEELRNEIEEKVVTYVVAKRLASKLLGAAVSMVEGLVEGEVSEDQLIAAQRALASGDRSLDHAVFSRLKVDGWDGDREPLFPNLEQLYEVLEKATQELEA